MWAYSIKVALCFLAEEIMNREERKTQRIKERRPEQHCKGLTQLTPEAGVITEANERCFQLIRNIQAINIIRLSVHR